MPRRSKIPTISKAGTEPPVPVVLPPSLSLRGGGSGNDPVSEEQAVWLSFRAQSRTDQQATKKTNTYLLLDPPLGDSEVEGWYQQERFADLACNVIGMPPVESFKRLTELMFPEVYRALKALITSEDNRGKAKGVELFLKMQGLLVDVVKSDPAEPIRALTDMLREVKQVAVIESYARSPSKSTLFLEGEYTNADDKPADQDD